MSAIIIGDGSVVVTYPDEENGEGLRIKVAGEEVAIWYEGDNDGGVPWREQAEDCARGYQAAWDAAKRHAFEEFAKADTGTLCGDCLAGVREITESRPCQWCGRKDSPEEPRGHDLHGGCEDCGKLTDNPIMSYGLKVCGRCAVARRENEPRGDQDGS